MLSIILPAYNESQSIQQNLITLESYLKDHLNTDYEILVINDGSTDDTADKAKAVDSPHIHVHSYSPNQGKGYAIKQGMIRANGEYVLFMDVDLATDLHEIEKFYILMQENLYDIIIGNRKTKEAIQRIKQPLYRRFLGKGFTFLCQILLGSKISDFTCGFKMYTRRAANIIFSKQSVYDWSFDAELVFIAEKYGLKIKELPVVWTDDPNSKVNVLSSVFKSLWGILIIRFNDLNRKYI